MVAIQIFLEFSPLLGETIQFDLHIFFKSVGEKPPTSFFLKSDTLQIPHPFPWRTYDPVTGLWTSPCFLGGKGYPFRRSSRPWGNGSWNPHYLRRVLAPSQVVFSPDFWLPSTVISRSAKECERSVTNFERVSFQSRNLWFLRDD